MTADEAITRISAALRARTGRAWEVRENRTTRAARREGWLLIRAPLARWISGGARGRRVMRPADVDAMAALFERRSADIAEWVGIEVCDEEYERVVARLEAPGEGQNG